MLVWWHENRYKISYSHFFRGGWRGVLQWYNVQAHKTIISACTIDFRPTLMYKSTSADLRQQHLTSFCAVCGILFYNKRESTVVSSGVRDVMLVTHICSRSAECLYATFCDQTWYCGAPPWAGMSRKKKRKKDSIFKVKVTVWVYLNVDPVQTKLVQCIPTPKLLWGETKKKEKNKEKKRQESNWPLNRLCSCIFSVFCNTRDTDLWHNIMHS